jgi:hypothetical protein
MKNKTATSIILIYVAIVLIIVNILELHGFGLAEIAIGCAIISSIGIIYRMLYRAKTKNSQ